MANQISTVRKCSYCKRRRFRTNADRCPVCYFHAGLGPVAWKRYVDRGHVELPDAAATAEMPCANCGRPSQSTHCSSACFEEMREEQRAQDRAEASEQRRLAALFDAGALEGFDDNDFDYCPPT